LIGWPVSCSLPIPFDAFLVPFAHNMLLPWLSLDLSHQFSTNF
jgi:hypothetical protein